MTCLRHPISLAKSLALIAVLLTGFIACRTMYADQAATPGLFNATLLLGVRMLGVHVSKAESRAIIAAEYIEMIVRT